MNNNNGFYFQEVGVLHAGNEEDLKVANELKFFLESVRGPRLEFQQVFQETQRAVAVQRNLRRYAKENLPLIVIISESFFQTIWPTELKREILEGILKYKNKLCVHIWTDTVNIRTVRCRSTQLSATLPGFRQVLLDKLRFMTYEEAGNELLTLLHSKTFDEKLLKINYPAVGSVEPSYANLQSTSATGPSVLPAQSSAKTSGTSVTRVSPIVKKKKKRPSDEDLLLADVPMKPIYEMSHFLDPLDVLGNDYKGLAAKLNFTRNDIGRFGMAVHRGEKPTVQLIRTLTNRHPDMKVKDLERVLIDMKRMDVVKHLKEKVYSNCRAA